MFGGTFFIARSLCKLYDEKIQKKQEPNEKDTDVDEEK